jgi:hypothetical protein
MGAVAKRGRLAAWVVLVTACVTFPDPSALDTASPQPSSIQTPGDPQAFTLYTHCGLGWSAVDYDGAFWEATGPGPLDDGAGNPPAGFGNPFDEGTIVRLDADHAMYRSSGGVVLMFRRLEQRPEMRACF